MLEDFLIEEQICLRVEYPWLWYHLNCGIADIHPLALGAAAGVPRTWQVLVLLFGFPLWSAHFYICSVVASTHWATVFDNPVQAVEDTLTGCQVLAGRRAERSQIQDQRKVNMAVHLTEVHPCLVEAFKVQCDDRRQWGYEHLLPSAGVNLLHFFICWAALAQLLHPTFSAALTEQPVVAHQQLHRGELVEAGLDGALLGTGCVTVGQSLEGPLVVLMVEIVSALCFSVLLWRTVCGWRAVPRAEAQVDFRDGAN